MSVFGSFFHCFQLLTSKRSTFWVPHEPLAIRTYSPIFLLSIFLPFGSLFLSFSGPWKNRAHTPQKSVKNSVDFNFQPSGYAASTLFWPFRSFEPKKSKIREKKFLKNLFWGKMENFFAKFSFLPISQYRFTFKPLQGSQWALRFIMRPMVPYNHTFDQFLKEFDCFFSQIFAIFDHFLIVFRNFLVT